MSLPFETIRKGRGFYGCWSSGAPDPRKMAEQRLVWRYGPDRAASILAGEDEQANADLAAWRALGRPKG